MGGGGLEGDDGEEDRSKELGGRSGWLGDNDGGEWDKACGFLEVFGGDRSGGTSEEGRQLGQMLVPFLLTKPLHATWEPKEPQFWQTCNW